MPELEGPPLPDGAVLVWGYFSELASARRYTSSGIPFAIAPSEILAYATLRDLALDPWELDALMTLDLAYLSSSAKRGGSE